MVISSLDDQLTDDVDYGRTARHDQVYSEKIGE